VPVPSFGVSRDASTSADVACERLRRIQKRIAAIVMEIIAIPPTVPPAMAPAWLPECECVGGAVELEDALAEEVLAEEVLAEGVLAENVYTPEAPKIAPGPYSGVSRSNVGVRP
jgi:hypothetical protein